MLGHTDAVGSDEFNMGLSRRRAMNVLQELVARGVSPNQLSIVAIGMRQPIATNDTPEGRAQNRRVEFLVSRSLAANLSIVENARVSAEFLPPGGNDPNVRSQVDALRLQRAGDGYTLLPIERLTLAQPTAITDEEGPMQPASLSSPFSLGTVSNAHNAPVSAARPAQQARAPSDISPAAASPHYQPKELAPGAQPNSLGPPVSY